MQINDFYIDERFVNYFSSLKQVFLYLTDECNLNCVQCLYKPNLVMKCSLDKELAFRILAIARELGAYKLSILGGEPTLYPHEEAKRLVSHARNIGYSYIRIDTNGHFNPSLVEDGFFELLNEVSISIDGYDAATNDSVRGQGSFAQTFRSLKLLVSSLPDVRITCCVTKQAVEKSRGLKTFVEKMIHFAEISGVNEINFHGVFGMGVPMDAWTHASHLDPVEWYNVSTQIVTSIKNNTYNIPVRFPIRLVKKEHFERHKEYFGYCPSKLGERILVHPTGIIRICSSLLSSCYGVATFNEKGIFWNDVNNELSEVDCNNRNVPCSHQKLLYSDIFVPVCFSLKPHQKDVVWCDLMKNEIINEQKIW